MGGGVSKWLSDHDRKIEALRMTPFFVLFDDDQLENIAKYFKFETISEGGLLGNQAMVVVLEGELAVSTLVPVQGGGSTSKGHVSELLCVKKKGDFFSRPSRELVHGRGSFNEKHSKNGGSIFKVVEAFDFTTIRAIHTTRILKLDSHSMESYLRSPGAASAGLLQTVLSTDIRQLLKTVPFLRPLKPGKLTSLSEMFVFKAFEAGTEVLREGDEDDNFYLVLAGELEVTAKVHPHDPNAKGSVTHAIEEAEESRHVANASPIDSLKRASLVSQNRQSTASTSSTADREPAPGSGEVTSEQFRNGRASSVASESGGAKAAQKPEEEEEDAAMDKSKDSVGSNSSENAMQFDLGRKIGGTASANGPLRTAPETPTTRSNKVPVIKPAPSMRLLRKSSSLVVPDADRVMLGTIGPGSYFGEMAIMAQMPRTATVKSTSKCLLARIHGRDFHNVLKLSKHVLDAFDLHAKERMVTKLYAFKLPFFAGISKSKLLTLAKLCELNQFQENDVIIQENTRSGKFHILINGMVSVSKNSEAFVRLSEGSYFGEISLLTDKPHLATVTACAKCVVLSVDKKGFDTFFADSPTLSAEFAMRLLGAHAIDLKHLIRHPLGFELFEQHMEKEFTKEHLDFYFAVEKFRQGAPDALSSADIKRKYIGSESETQVNISAGMAQEVLDLPESPDMFDIAQEEVYKLMKRDNFERFKKTPFFDELINAIQCYKDVKDIPTDDADCTRAEILAIRDPDNEEPEAETA